MPLSRQDQHTKQTIQATAEYLRENGQDEKAAVVDSMLTPTGAAFLRRLHADRTPTPMNISMAPAEREHLHAAAKEAGEDLSVAGDEALYQIANGLWQPPQYTRPSARTGASDEATLNLKVSKQLKDQVAGLLKDPKFAKGLGWKPRSASILVRLFLRERYPMFEGIDTAEVVRAHQAGASEEELVERFGIAPDALALLLEPRRGLSQAEVDELVRRYTVDKAGTYVLADEFGVHPTTVMRTLDQAGVKRRPTRGKKSSD